MKERRNEGKKGGDSRGPEGGIGGLEDCKVANGMNYSLAGMGMSDGASGLYV